MAVGRVEDYVLTSREVQMTTLMENALYGAGSPSSGKLRLEGLDSKSFFDHVNDALLERSLALEAKNFDVVRIEGKELREFERKIAKTLSPTPAWKSLEPSETEMKGLLERKLRAKAFIKFRHESSNLPVTDAEAKRYFEENHAKYGEAPFENFRENIKALLSRTQVDRRLKDWYEVVKAKYKTKNLLSEL
jgi:hypothetical protein